MNQEKSLILPHGGYRKLKSFQLAQLVYDLTVRFCERYINKFSRTRDQMVQAARSGVQNIAEGSQASATSKKTEIRLTQVARASLEELKLDYEDFLRQRGLTLWPREHSLRQGLIDARCRTVDDVALWIIHHVRGEGGVRVSGLGGLSGHTGQVDPLESTQSTLSTPSTKSMILSEFSANAAHTLITVTNHLLDRQVQSLAKDFAGHGGFTERLYHFRKHARFQD